VSSVRLREAWPCATVYRGENLCVHCSELSVPPPPPPPPPLPLLLLLLLLRST